MDTFTNRDVDAGDDVAVAEVVEVSAGGCVVAEAVDGGGVEVNTVVSVEDSEPFGEDVETAEDSLEVVEL